jgi:hypothetical protein
MGIVNNVLAGASGNQGYNLIRSLRFRASASAYLSKSYIFGTTANDTSLYKKTYSFWMKRGILSTDQMILSNYTSAGNLWQIGFDTSDRLYIFQQTASAVLLNKTTTQVFRDPAAWYHIVVSVDTTLATAEDRFQIWVNGTRVTAWSTNTIAAQNSLAISYFTFTSGTWTSNFGRRGDALYYFDGYLSEVNAIDGQALTPSSFGSTNTITGVWQPKKYAGTYGTNGFYLPFTDNSAATATTIGKDFSGNGNNWTPNNISVTAGATYDSMTDVPTLTSTTAANYCVVNPLVGVGVGGASLSNGNLSYITSVASAMHFESSIAVSSGKWYWEYTVTSGNFADLHGVCLVGLPATSYAWPEVGTVGYYGNNGQKYVSGVGSAYGASFTTNDVIGTALNKDTNTITFYKNNVSQGAISLPTNDPMMAYFADGTSGSATSGDANFGQRPFVYTPPTGFLPLNTYNISDYADTINPRWQ